jgi:hypothetical protein
MAAAERVQPFPFTPSKRSPGSGSCEAGGYQLGEHEEVCRYELRAVGRVLERLELPDRHPVLHNGGASQSKIGGIHLYIFFTGLKF